MPPWLEIDRQHLTFTVNGFKFQGRNASYENYASVIKYDRLILLLWDTLREHFLNGITLEGSVRSAIKRSMEIREPNCNTWPSYIKPHVEQNSRRD